MRVQLCMGELGQASVPALQKSVAASPARTHPLRRVHAMHDLAGCKIGWDMYPALLVMAVDV